MNNPKPQNGLFVTSFGVIAVLLVIAIIAKTPSQERDDASTRHEAASTLDDERAEFGRFVDRLDGQMMEDFADDGKVNSDYSHLKPELDSITDRARQRVQSMNRKPHEQGYSLDERKKAAVATLVAQGWSRSEAELAAEDMLNYGCS